MGEWYGSSPSHCSSSNNWIGRRNVFEWYCNGFGLYYKGVYSLGWLVGSQHRVVYHSYFSDFFLIPSPSSILQNSWQRVDCLCTRRRWSALPGTETISSAGGTWLLSHSKGKETFIDICSVIFSLSKILLTISLTGFQSTPVGCCMLLVSIYEVYHSSNAFHKILTIWATAVVIFTSAEFRPDQNNRSGQARDTNVGWTSLLL